MSITLPDYRGCSDYIHGTWWPQEKAVPTRRRRSSLSSSHVGERRRRETVRRTRTHARPAGGVVVVGRPNSATTYLLILCCSMQYIQQGGYGFQTLLIYFDAALRMMERYCRVRTTINAIELYFLLNQEVCANEIYPTARTIVYESMIRYLLIN